MPRSVARKSVQIKVSVTPELHERLREVAAQLGQAPATLASVAIGVYVAQQSRSLSAGRDMAEAVAAKVAPELVEHMRAAGGAT